VRRCAPCTPRACAPGGPSAPVRRCIPSTPGAHAPGGPCAPVRHNHPSRPRAQRPACAGAPVRPERRACPLARGLVCACAFVRQCAVRRELPCTSPLAPAHPVHCCAPAPRVGLGPRAPCAGAAELSRVLPRTLRRPPSHAGAPVRPVQPRTPCASVSERPVHRCARARCASVRPCAPCARRGGGNTALTPTVFAVCATSPPLLWHFRGGHFASWSPPPPLPFIQPMLSL